MVKVGLGGVLCTFGMRAAEDRGWPECLSCREKSLTNSFSKTLGGDHACNRPLPEK